MAYTARAKRTPPRVTGFAVALRPDLFPVLAENAQSPLLIREVVVGVTDLAPIQDAK
jgi:hypothetical protein